MRIKVAKYVLHLCEYGISFSGLWYVSFYYSDFMGDTHYDAHHARTLEDLCEWCGCSVETFKCSLERYDFINKEKINCDYGFRYSDTDSAK